MLSYSWGMTSNKRGCEAQTPSLVPPIEASPLLLYSHYGRRGRAGQETLPEPAYADAPPAIPVRPLRRTHLPCASTISCFSRIPALEGRLPMVEAPLARIWQFIRHFCKMFPDLRYCLPSWAGP